MDANTALIGAGLCAGLGAYHHVLYPAAMAVLGRVDTRSTDAPVDQECDTQVEILMPAFNEGRFVAEKIEALAAQDYPHDLMKVVIGCDGCTDGTARIAEAAAARHPSLNIEIRDFAQNRGKTIVLNALIQSAKADIIVFTDVSALPAPDAIRRAVGHFRNPAIGAVGGGYALPSGAGRGERQYWGYQSAIKRGESRIAGLIGAHGAFHAARRTLIGMLPEDTINDDFIIPMRIAASGWTTVYDPQISVREVETVSEKAESRRRRRIGAGNLQQLLRLVGPILSSGKAGLMFALISGKGLRVAMGPLFLIGLACLAVAGLESLPALAGFVAVIVATLKGPGRYAANGHIQSLIGAIQYLAGGYRRWHRVSPQTV